MTSVPRYRIEAPEWVPFRWPIRTLRLLEFGRLGNRFYAVLNAMLLARALGYREIQIDAFAGGPTRLPLLIEDITVTRSRPNDIRCPTLAGHFFNTLGFEPVFAALSPAFVVDTVHRYVKPVFAALLGSADVGREDEIVLSIRGGDIFPDPGSPSVAHPFYVPPPVAFYTRAIDHAVATQGVRRVRAVSEDRRYPGLPLIEAHAAACGLAYSFQSSSLEEDFAALLHARHLALPFSTFGETAAAMSSVLRSYYAFRHIEAHEFSYRTTNYHLHAVLAAHHVAAHVIEDVDADFIPERSWTNSAEQRDLIRTFESSKLRIRSQSGVQV